MPSRKPKPPVIALPKAAYKGRWGVGEVRPRACTFSDQRQRRQDRAARKDLQQEGH